MEKGKMISEAMKVVKFVEKIIDIQSPEEMQKAFAIKEIDLSLEEAKEVISTIKKFSKSKSGELSDDDLEGIAGGMSSGTKAAITVLVMGGLTTTAMIAGPDSKFCKVIEDLRLRL